MVKGIWAMASFGQKRVCHRKNSLAPLCVRASGQSLWNPQYATGRSYTRVVPGHQSDIVVSSFLRVVATTTAMDSQLIKTYESGPVIVNCIYFAASTAS